MESIMKICPWKYGQIILVKLSVTQFLYKDYQSDA